MSAPLTKSSIIASGSSVSVKLLASLALTVILFLVNAPIAISAKSTQDVDITYNGYKFNSNKTVSLTFEVIARSKSGLNQIDFALPKTVQATDLSNSNKDFQYRMENESTPTYNAVSFKSIGQGPRDGQSDNFSYTLTDTDFFQLNSIEVYPKAGGPNESVSFRTTEPTTLPVQLVTFTGKADKNSIKLNWVTAQEEINEKFEIERSLDGKTFTVVGTVKGQGTTKLTTNYKWQDAAVASGTVYYRLKQIDLNGNFEYSPITAVKNLFAGKLVFVKAYPNPTHGVVSIQGLESGASETKVAIFSATGQLLKTINLLSPDSSVDLSNLQDGFYFLTISQNGQTTKLRVVKGQ